MSSAQGHITKIALNVTRTRVTVLVFNLTIIVFLLSITVARSTALGRPGRLVSSVALFAGFCLTLLGLFWLLYSQDWDEEGLSRAWPFSLGSVTTYLALSQTVTAFMHEYLIGLRTWGAPAAATPPFPESLSALGDEVLVLLLLMGGAAWTLVTYVAPVLISCKVPIPGWRRWWGLATYFFALQLPIYWVYARAWQAEYAVADHPLGLSQLFALQFVQPLLWFL